jgi:SanA protein
MYTYLRNRGIPAEDINIDNDGHDTFASVSNLAAQHLTGSIGIVTQYFHLPRTLFIAQSLGLQPVGIISDRASYLHAQRYEMRESFARIKAFFDVVGRWLGVH